jgi:hypothetical protein
VSEAEGQEARQQKNDEGRDRSSRRAAHRHDTLLSS